jgi:hypothetical protein
MRIRIQLIIVSADPDPVYHFDADSDSTFQFDADSDPQHCG